VENAEPEKRRAMDIQTLTTFFMWMTIINGGLFVYWAAICAFAPDWLYRMQSRWFRVPRESFDVAIYAFLGVFKIVFIVFNLAPYLALSIVG
jgi:Family of unknown function (DUF6868)